MILEAISKRCSMCKVSKPYTKFHKHKGTKDGLHSLCKNCKKKCAKKYYNNPKNQIKIKEYRVNSRGRLRVHHLDTKYGLTQNDYDQLLLKQNNKCLICGIDFSKVIIKNIHIDHCHTTGKIRGILCINCNQGLGSFKDNKKYLEEAIKYLQNN